jgi:hypothetical protein
MSEEAVIKIMKILGAAYGKDSIDPETTEIYVRMLSDIDDDILEQSCIDHISRSQWFPKISELRKESVTLSLSTRLIPSAYQAWQEVIGYAERFGHTSSPSWSHPLIGQTVDSLGWYHLCMSENQISDRARFIEAYMDFKERAIEDAVTMPEIKQLAASMNKQIEGEIQN